jgi:DNA polymerase-3 subunit epsilon
MIRNLAFDRPLAIVDLETTGTDPQADRIIEISILKLVPGAEPDHRTRRVNPGIPISAEATAIHGIRDEDVAGSPSFRALARGILSFIEGCDLCGYNLRFDLRLISTEYQRAGLAFPVSGRRSDTRRLPAPRAHRPPSCPAPLLFIQTTTNAIAPTSRRARSGRSRS